MKKFIITSLLVASIAAGSTLKAQDNQKDYLGLPGDNLNLYAVMKLFQNSKTLEDFERNLNDPNSNINNLDLNGDNLVDYIKVIDNVDGDVHNIVLQDAVTPKENQDVAVFTVQRFPNGQVQIQLTGDEALYGKDYIIEPIYDDVNQAGTPNPGYAGNAGTVNGVTVTYVRTTPAQIATWPVVRFIFLPTYTVWHSSWYWGYYPSYWHPWRTYSWNYYYGFQSNWDRVYYSHYRRWDTHRYSRWNTDYYNTRRSYSQDVRHQIQVGNYKTTYSHPEDRRHGEEMFAKVHPDQYRRTTAASSVNTSRRTTTSTVTSTGRPAVNNSGANRNTTRTTITSKPVNNNNGNHNGVNRSNSTVVNRNVTKTNPAKTTSTSRTTTTVTNRQTGNSSAVHNPPANKTVSRSANTKVKSSSARTTVKNSSTQVKKVEKTNGNNDSNRRRQ
jgi:hypothetical protein